MQEVLQASFVLLEESAAENGCSLQPLWLARRRLEEACEEEDAHGAACLSLFLTVCVGAFGFCSSSPGFQDCRGVVKCCKATLGVVQLSIER